MKYIKIILVILVIACSLSQESIDGFNYNRAESTSVFSLNKSEAINTFIVDSKEYNNQWYITHTNINKAWRIVDQKRTIKVAVVDSGVDYNHPDLVNRVDRSLGYDFVNGDNDAMDDNWHGTHIAGIIAAEGNNNEGIIGTTGMLDVKIIPVKVLDENGEGSAYIIAKGIEYAVDNGADIVNLSIGFKVRDEYIKNALNYAREKGVFVVASSGNYNSNADLSSPSGDEFSYTVAAVTEENTKAYFSNFGNSIKIAAPGTSIYSTMPGGSYEAKDGTSMSAGIVTGIAAMLKAQNPSLKPEEIEQILNKTAVDILESKKDIESGFGLIDAEGALKQLNLSRKAFVGRL